MFLQKRLFSLIASAPFLLGAGAVQPQDTDLPAVIESLQGQGVEIVQEFEAGEHVRAFAGLAGGEPIAVYVLPDGTAITGTRLNAKAEISDQQILQDLVAKPMSDRAWALLEDTNWVRDGAEDAPRIVYSFTDANCSYCHLFWQASRPWVDAGKVQLRHLMVGVIREDSPAKAAAILGSSDPSAALRANEVNFDKGGISPAESISDEIQQTLEDHQLLMMSMGFRGTPGIVVQDDDGLIQKYNGMPQEADLMEVLGPR